MSSCRLEGVLSEAIRTGRNIALDAAAFSSSMRSLPSKRRVNGWVTERSIVHAWKACVPLYGTGGSNPPPSATDRSQPASAQGGNGMDCARGGCVWFVFGCLFLPEAAHDSIAGVFLRCGAQGGWQDGNNDHANPTASPLARRPRHPVAAPEPRGAVPLNPSSEISEKDPFHAE